MIQCTDDADVTIATTAVDMAKIGKKVLLWGGDDTDLFAIVLRRLSKITQEVRPSISFFRPSSSSTIDLTSLMTFIDPDAPHHDLFDASKHLILTMYNVTNKRCSTLEELRLQ